MKPEVVALGELLIDFTGHGYSDQGNPVLEANPGGAPCNVLAMLAKLGKSTAFIGKVGDDVFGHMLHKAILEAGISADGLVTDSSVNTTLAIVMTAEDGDRDFSFYRNPGADTMLRREEVLEELILNCRIFHFGTLSLTDEPSRTTTYAAVEAARKAGALISFDPNLRPPLWQTIADAKREMEWGCRRCDILKLAEDELTFLTGCADIEEGAHQLRSQYANIRLLFVTRGKAGSVCFYEGLTVNMPTFLQVKTVDTTGAGDTFLGSCLAWILDSGLDDLDGERLSMMLRFANAASSLVTTKKGALRAMPQREEILALLKSQQDS